MKLRCKGDSVRLRLGPREVERLVRAGSVTERTRFGPSSGSLDYTLEVSTTAATVSATFDGHGLRVAVPSADARRWAASAEQVSIAAEQDVGDGRRLSILIEKDFDCLHGERADDAYPHPERSGAAAQSKGLAGSG